MSLSGAAVLGAGFLQAAGSVYSNAVNSATQLKINQENAALQYGINMDQIEAARMNNETAIELSNTAHQREVRDLRDANLNPILSAHGSGASVPSLDTPGLDAPSLTAPHIDNPLAGIASAVQQALAFTDQHNLNEARLAAAGFTGDKHQQKTLVDILGNKAVQDASTALQESRNREQEAEMRNISLAIEADAFKDVYGLDLYGSPDRHTSDKSTFRHGLGYQLLKEGIISDLKVRANRNMRENISSARGIADSVSGWVRNFVPKVPKRK